MRFKRLVERGDWIIVHAVTGRDRTQERRDSKESNEKKNQRQSVCVES